MDLDKFNDQIKIRNVGDPFTQDELVDVRGFGPQSLEEAQGRDPVSTWVVETIRALEGIDPNKLLLRMDRFDLDGKPKPQALHFDRMHPEWLKTRNSVQGVLIIGVGTGMTVVCRPFQVPRLSSWAEAQELANMASTGAIDLKRFSVSTGNWIISEGMFLHGRGRCKPGIRLAYDFSVR